MAEVEARLAAVEAERADYGAVPAAINAFGENQRELNGRVNSVESRLGSVESQLATVEVKVDDTGASVSSIEEGVAEVRDLLVRALDR